MCQHLPKKTDECFGIFRLYHATSTRQYEKPTVNDRLICSLKDFSIWMDVDGNSSFNDTYIHIYLLLYTLYSQQMVI